MAIIKADNLEIEKRLIELERLVIEGGGGIHSDLVIHNHEGNLSIETKEPMVRGKEIIRLSREVLSPEDQYILHVKDDLFDVDFPEYSTMSSLQKKIIECMVGLYNSTNKITQQKNGTLLLSIMPYPELIKKLRLGRTFFNKAVKWLDYIQQKDSKQTFNDEEFESFLIDTFVRTRHLGYSDYIRESSVSLIMPIIDFMNHHWAGAGFNIGKGTRKGDLAVACSQPIKGSLECYAFYGIMDSFDTLIRYDFVDEFAPVVRSIPIELDVPNVGTIKVNSLTGAINKKKLTKQISDLDRYLPTMRIDKEKHLLTISHLMIPVKEGSFMALRRVLHVVLANLTHENVKLDKKIRDAWIKEAEEKVLKANIDYYNDLKAYTDKLIKTKGEVSILRCISDLATLQLKKIDLYSKVKKTL